jgi:TnpA family transposase
MQVSISIQAGRIASPMLLRKLSQEGRHNRLFAAARELGRAKQEIDNLSKALEWAGRAGGRTETP